MPLVYVEVCDSKSSRRVISELPRVDVIGSVLCEQRVARRKLDIRRLVPIGSDLHFDYPLYASLLS